MTPNSPYWRKSSYSSNGGDCVEVHIPPALDASPDWFKSSHSSNGGQCVEVAANLVPTHDLVPVRDSKTPSGPVLTFPATAFSSFVAGGKAGEFRSA
ncbi:DUF397 domain-containing protein [Streptomyces sampsonii]|uniref:DUF397 domain-containing protein n=1 Tax=Streptomyces sampsonii TaxID=42239 RepID=UPI0008F4B4C7|nr:DUF397 domain-containing protein [Streptomyces sampsonii]